MLLESRQQQCSRCLVINVPEFGPNRVKNNVKPPDTEVMSDLDTWFLFGVRICTCVVAA